jgi:hydrogenase expression/formation protein HypD
MKYMDEFRQADLAKAQVQQINQLVKRDRSYKIMEFCGGHTHTLHRYGIPKLLVPPIELIHGPGCPVCVLPIARIDQAIQLAKQDDVVFCSYGDMLRVPAGKGNTLLKAKAQGADVRIVYSILDALKLAQTLPDKKVIFFAIGFETTTPPTAVAILQAQRLQLDNFFIFCNHVLTPSAMRCLLDVQPEQKIAIDGFIGPAHVSVISGVQAYQSIAEQYQKPIVIAGFEPLDVLQAISMLIDQINVGEHQVQNQYHRAVTQQGNVQAQQLIDQVLQLRASFEWRGLGSIADSALQIRSEFSAFDAELHFPLAPSTAKEYKGCECAAILRAEKKPHDCPLFAKICHPDNPLGSCMVSSEGACAAYYAYDRQWG